MKRLLAVLLLALTSVVQATEVSRAFIPNQNGGKIIFTLEDCVWPDEKPGPAQMFKVLSYSTNTRVMLGCWTLLKQDQTQAVVVWFDPVEVKTYPISDMRPMPNM